MPIKIRAGDEAGYARHLALKTRVGQRDLAIGFEPTRAAAPALFVEGAQFYPSMLDDLRAATSSIHIVEFGIRPGAVAERFAKVLKEKAAAGLPVRVIVDARGSRPDGESRELFAELAAAGVEIYVNRPFDLRAPLGPLGGETGQRWNLENLFAVDHRKFFVIDGRVGWVGTAGIEDRFEDGRHHDLFVRMEGTIVHQLQTVFLASYRWHGGAYRLEEVPCLYPKPSAGDVPALTLQNAPGGYRPISRAILRHIERAERTLDIMNPYIAHPVIFQRLIAAARRGVRVRIIAPPNYRTWTTGYVRLYHHEALTEAGVELWTYPAVAHAKAFIRDGEHVLVGSCNLETWSLRRFFELDVSIRSPELAREFADELFEPDIAASVPATGIRGLQDRLLATAFHLASPLL